MTSELERLRKFILQYLNKSLSPEERKEFDEGLEKYPEIRKEISEFLEIKKIYQEMEKVLPPPSDELFRKIQGAIKSRPSRAVCKEKGVWETVAEHIHDLLTSPRLPWTLASTQLIIIILMLSTGGSENLSFRTLTSRDVFKKDAIRVNLVFEPDAREKEIRQMLNMIGARIVAGPSKEGLYIIGIADYKEAEKALELLKGSNIVRYAKKDIDF